MRLANLTLLLIALLGCATGNTQSESGVDERVVIHATAATAGLYSDRWDVRLVLDGDSDSAKYEAFFFERGPLKGKAWFWDRDAIAVRSAIEDSDFFSLPGRLTNDLVELHKADIALTVKVGGSEHTVSIYDPDQLEAQSEKRRFMLVWDAVFSRLPVQPEW